MCNLGIGYFQNVYECQLYFKDINHYYVFYFTATLQWPWYMYSNMRSSILIQSNVCFDFDFNFWFDKF